MLEKEKSYNEKHFKAKYNKESFIGNYSYNKNYLYGLLMESLGRFNSGKYVDIQLREMITGYEILTRKGLLQQAKKLIDKAYKLSAKNEKQYYTLLINTCRINLKNMITETDLRNLYVEEIMNSQNQLLDTIKNQNRYYMLSTKILTFMNSKGSARSEQDRLELMGILSDPLLGDIKLTRTLDDKCYFYFTRHLCYLGLNDLENAYVNSKASIDLLKDEDPLSPLMRGRFRTAYGSHLLLLRYFPEKTEEFISSVRYYRRAIYPDRNSLIGRFIDSYNSEILFNIQKARFDENVKLIREFEEELRGLNEHEKSAEYYYFASNAAYTLFISEHYESCRSWLNIALNTGGKVISYRASTMIIILRLLLSYELMEFNMLDSGLLSAYRYFRTKNRLYSSEKLILDFVRNTTKNIPEEKLIENFDILRLKLLKISNNPDEKKAFEPLDVICWLESKISKKPFITLLEEKSSTNT
ncbi:MAG: hypothetical protein IT281_03545 [Ignavibacteria bacterium]|nr:hypothetical protein [Ignavibacteria bacterium]MCC7158594.1 hypothetical protein [Ignavibacteria bacterium]